MLEEATFTDMSVTRKTSLDSRQTSKSRACCSVGFPIWISTTNNTVPCVGLLPDRLTGMYNMQSSSNPFSAVGKDPNYGWELVDETTWPKPWKAKCHWAWQAWAVRAKWGSHPFCPVSCSLNLAWRCLSVSGPAFSTWSPRRMGNRENKEDVLFIFAAMGYRRSMPDGFISN